jgi:hypothetical protein
VGESSDCWQQQLKSSEEHGREVGEKPKHPGIRRTYVALTRGTEHTTINVYLFGGIAS